MRDYSLSSTSTPDMNLVNIYIPGTCTGGVYLMYRRAA